jgi:hypothetical protein
MQPALDPGKYVYALILSFSYMYLAAVVLSYNSTPECLVPIN